MKLAQASSAASKIETALAWPESQVEPAMSHARSYELFINGKWRAGGSRATLPVINPATEKVFASVA
ncbi:hypothetical protein EN933_05370, partial [Mesorhizobium sp. M7A.F.Ca.US.001.01.1.1]